MNLFENIVYMVKDKVFVRINLDNNSFSIIHKSYSLSQKINAEWHRSKVSAKNLISSYQSKKYKVVSKESYIDALQ